MIIPEIFFEDIPDDGKEYVKIIGRENNQRVYKYIKKEYINNVENMKAYKVLIPQATGSGKFGENFSAPFVEPPQTGSTETFISIGNFDDLESANALRKYICTKFARTLLGVLKVTQNGNKPVWRYIPIQDFTDKSDVDWSVSIANIDKQLYKKYGFSEEEIAFIENNVKEME